MKNLKMIKNLKCEGLIEFHQHFVEQVSVTSNQHQDRLERNSCFTGSLNVCAKTCLDCFDHPERIVETCERSSVVGFHERNIGFAQDHVETREQVDTVGLYSGEVCLLCKRML